MPEDFTYVQRIIYPEIFFNVCIPLVIISEIRRAWTTQLMLLGRGPQPCGYQIHDLMILLESLNRALESTQELTNLLLYMLIKLLRTSKLLHQQKVCGMTLLSNLIALQYQKNASPCVLRTLLNCTMYGFSKFQILPFVVLQPDFWF